MPQKILIFGIRISLATLKISQHVPLTSQILIIISTIFITDTKAGFQYAMRYVTHVCHGRHIVITHTNFLLETFYTPFDDF
jgi:hypothetical protein